MHPYFISLLTGSILGYFILDWVFMKSARFYVYYTAFCLVSAVLVYVFRTA
jgi:hypothetical protein